MLKYCWLVVVLILVPVISGFNIDSLKDELLDAVQDDSSSITKDVEIDDMMLSKDQNNYFYSDNDARRNGITNPLQLWPQATVVYEFDSSMEMQAVKNVFIAMFYIQSISCVKFVERNQHHHNYVTFKNGNTCRSGVGMRKEPQTIIISSKFCDTGNVVHELLHTLGFFHMHTTQGRDKYITINWNNIKQSALQNFKQIRSSSDMFNTPYDLSSILHYPTNAFAINDNVPTIKAKTMSTNIGQRKYMTPGDIIRLNRLYKCSEESIQELQKLMMDDTKKQSDNSDNSELSDKENPSDNDEQLNEAIELDEQDSTLEELVEKVGDMISKESQEDCAHGKDASVKNGFNNDPFFGWPDGVVYYQFDEPVTKELRQKVTDAMKNIADVSCIQFKVGQSKQGDVVRISSSNDTFCSPYIGWSAYGDNMLLLNDKSTKGDIIHNLLHTLGFPHMHIVNERDNHINIKWDNIIKAKTYYFRKAVVPIKMYNTSYDTGSIMHFPSTAFARNTSIPTIIPLDPLNVRNMGQREKMSDGDILRLNRKYKCDAKLAPATSKILESKENDFDIYDEKLNEAKGSEEEDDDSEKDTKVGDMLLNENQLEYLYAKEGTRRNGLTNEFFNHWPEAIVYYEYNKAVASKYREIVASAMKHIEDVSCIKFKVRSENASHKNYVEIKAKTGCSSPVGMRRVGVQPLNLDTQLCTEGNVIHELLHTLGFLHMHTANERDDHIKIQWDNVMENAKQNFEQILASVSMFNTSYDFDSIMHYPPKAFAKNTTIHTIIPLNQRSAKNMGQRKAMSEGDILRLNRMYECGKKTIEKSKEIEVKIKDKTTPKPVKKITPKPTKIVTSKPEIKTTLKPSGKNTIQAINAKVLEEEDSSFEYLAKEGRKVGDMILNESQIEFLYAKNTKGSNRLANEYFNHWPEGIVYYKYHKSVTHELEKKVTAAMKQIEDVSCVKFQVKCENATNKNYVQIVAKTFCSSLVGMRSNGIQPLFLDAERCTEGNIIHELLHTLGFIHMHTANERNNHIKIQWDNVIETARTNFQQVSASVGMYDTSYDTGSIMHYPPLAFAKNKSSPTIIPLDPINAKNMGQRKKMSEGDVLRLNRMYKCEDKSIVKTKSKVIEPEVNDFNDIDDMILNREQMDELYSPNAAKRNGLKTAFHHWPNAVVLYEFDSKLASEFVEKIHEAMIHISNISCVKFEPKQPNDRNYIFITEGNGCSSEVGMRNTGRQLMNLNPSICVHGKIVHELLHSLGFLHMHTANERDDYLEVKWDNIKKSAALNFHQFKSHVSMFGTKFDYDSILHYSEKAFAIDKSKPTLVPLHKDMAKNMGQRIEMSQGDITRLNQMYKCPIKAKPTNLTSLPQDNEISETPSDYSHQQIQNQLFQQPRPFENVIYPIQNIENQQLGQQIRTNERQLEQKQFFGVQPQYGMPSMHQSVILTKTPLNLPGQEPQPSQYLPNQPVQQPQPSQNLPNQPIQQHPSENEVKNTKPNEIPSAIGDTISNKPCGPNIFMTFLFKISQKQ